MEGWYLNIYYYYQVKMYYSSEDYLRLKIIAKSEVEIIEYVEAGSKRGAKWLSYNPFEKSLDTETLIRGINMEKVIYYDIQKAPSYLVKDEKLRNEFSRL
jgi:hypothetical protein